MALLPHGEKISKICLFVLTELTNVTDRQTDKRTDRQTPHAGIYRAYAWHRAVKKSSHFHEILYTAADFELDERHMIKKLHWTDSEFNRTYFFVLYVFTIFICVHI